jgi:hypothetical protein
MAPKKQAAGRSSQRKSDSSDEEAVKVDASGLPPGSQFDSTPATPTRASVPSDAALQGSRVIDLTEEDVDDLDFGLVEGTEVVQELISKADGIERGKIRVIASSQVMKFALSKAALNGAKQRPVVEEHADLQGFTASAVDLLGVCARVPARVLCLPLSTVAHPMHPTRRIHAPIRWFPRLSQ